MQGALRVFLPVLWRCRILPTSAVLSQSKITVATFDSASGEPLPGVNVSVARTNLGGVTNARGEVILVSMPNGPQTLVFSCIGYRTVRLPMTFPITSQARGIDVNCVQTAVDEETETVRTTTTSYHIDNVPVRVELKGQEDLDESMTDHPQDISELFLESTGIHVLRTSAVSNSVSIELQGLDGNHTQILKDGFPLYGGLSAGLSVTQIPPSDLNRVDILKGPSSSLCGGGAIVGIINLVSQELERQRVLTILVNAPAKPRRGSRPITYS